MISSKKYFVASLLAIFIISIGLLSFKPAENSNAANVKFFYETGIRSTNAKVVTLLAHLEAWDGNTQKLETLKLELAESRLAYKQIEFLIAYFNAEVAKSINGALVIEVEESEDEHDAIKPDGLQVVEALLYEDNPLANKLDMVIQLKRVSYGLNSILTLNANVQYADYKTIEAVRLEIIRILAMGLNGFDNPENKNCFKETAAALNGIAQCLKTYLPNHVIYNQIEKAEKYCIENVDFDEFNRAVFIKDYLNPIYSSLNNFKKTAKISHEILPSPLRYTAQNIFDELAWNPYFYAENNTDTANNTQIQLGKLLFFDPALSGNNERSCASCHKPNMAFTDGKATSIAFNSNGNLARNTPSIINAGLQRRNFVDLRVLFLEDQIRDVHQNTSEMNANSTETSEKLNGSMAYKAMFKTAFKLSADSTISNHSIQRAIAAYERSLVRLSSRTDLYLRGDAKQLTCNEINGFNLFMGKAQCGTCHFAPLFGGNVPPHFINTEWETIGTPATKVNNSLDTDPGRYNVFKLKEHRGAFRTPSIRNAAITAPYMHNGVYNTLNEVMDFYQAGGGQGLGYDVPYQTLAADNLNLSPNEIKDIIAFMGSLSDTTGTTSIPISLPIIEKQPELNGRLVGGRY